MLTRFPTWQDVLDHVQGGLPVWYHAPLDVRAVRVTAKLRAKTRTLRIKPPTRDADPFVADSGHLDRFRFETDRIVRDDFFQIVEAWHLGRDGAMYYANRTLVRRGHVMHWQGFAAECSSCGKSAHVRPRPDESYGAGFELHGEASDVDCPKPF